MSATSASRFIQSVSQLFHGLTPRSPLHRLSVRFRRSRSNTSTEYSLPGATQLSQVRSISPSAQRAGCSLSLLIHAYVPVKRHRGRTHTRITQTSLTTIQAHQHTRTTSRRSNPRPAQQPHLPQHRSRTLLERSPRLTQKRPPPANPTRPPPAPRVTYTMHTQIYKECECECKCVSCDEIKGSTQHSWSCGLSRGAPLDNGALQHVLNSLRRAAFQFGFRNFASRASPVKRRRPGDACYLIACAQDVGRRSSATSHVGVYPYYRLWLQLAVRRNHFLEPSRGVDCESQ